ncbi:response regulator [Chthonobacter rhizosphaerae]|uniref:response regulator n=1 Tax=Chthonobacter rhizosphaerae TaxID=2735553 RepID=UPI001FECEC12|nr:response regulator [Chthonobacter rhizosphaerae]
MILVVEDEPIPLMLAQDVLEEAGYDTMAVSTADEALALLEARPDDIDIVFTDVRMPGSIDGLELARIVCGRWPDKRVIITSGHLSAAEAAPHCVRFVCKPWTTVDLLNVVI